MVEVTRRSLPVWLAIVVGAVLAMLTVGLTAQQRPAQAQAMPTPPPPTLTGEELTVNTFETLVGVGAPVFPFQTIRIEGGTGTLMLTSQCDRTGGTIQYTVSGIAAGPYPGTFTETGTVTLGATNTGSGVLRGRAVLGFTAEFMIDSPLGQVSGTKTLDPAAPSLSDRTGSCAEIGDAGNGPTELFPNFITDASYEATISTSAGTFTDKGLTGVRAQSNQEPQPSPTSFGADTGFFVETYTSVLPEPIPVAPPPGGGDDDDDDDDGEDGEEDDGEEDDGEEEDDG